MLVGCGCGVQVYPLDVAFDKPGDVPEKLKANKNYVGVDKFTVSEVSQ